MAHAPPDQGCRAYLRLARTTPTVADWQRLNPFSRGGLCVCVCMCMCACVRVEPRWWDLHLPHAHLTCASSWQVAPVFDKLAESRKKREPPLRSELKPTAMEASHAPKAAAPDHAEEVLSKATDFLKVRNDGKCRCCVTQCGPPILSS
jgi:hypothetical protein